MKDLILGMHLLFAREGETIDGGVVSATYKPDTTPEANYTAVATVEDWEPSFVPKIITRRAPSPGKYRDRKSIIVSSELTYALSLQEWSEMTFAELLLGGNKPVAGVFTPNSMDALLTGWWIMQGYDQEDNEIVVLNVWGEATVKPYKFGEKLDPYALQIRQLYSTLNTGSVSNLT
jgi:hypothetical protein